MTGKGESDAWTTYWQASRLDSCISQRTEQDYVDLYRFWASVVQQATEGARIVDLAAGNGAVAVRLAQAAQAASKDIRIDAVDLAAIHPEQFLVEYKDVMAAIRFHGETDVCALPFNDGTFDFAVSQFGFEYAPAASAAKEMMRILRPGGGFRLLIHHCDSALVSPNVAKIDEINALVAKGGVVPRVLAFLSAEPDVRTARLGALEEAGQKIRHLLGTPLPRTSHEIFTSIGQLIDRQDLTFEFRLQAASGMKDRLIAEQHRMQQLSAAALSSDQAQQLKVILLDAGATEVSLSECLIGPDRALLGWRVEGIKGHV